MVEALTGDNESLAAAPATAVAVNVTVPALGALAVTRFAPAIVPSVRRVLALPTKLVTDVAVDRLPPPAVMVQVTVTPDLFAPALVRTLTTKSDPNRVLTVPV